MKQRIFWSVEARADMRVIDRDTALRLLKALDRFVKTGAGDIRQLSGFFPTLFRLRTGDWRIIYRHAANGAIEVIRVRNRREAYR